MARARFVKAGNKCRKSEKKKRVGRGKMKRWMCVPKRKKRA